MLLLSLILLTPPAVGIHTDCKRVLRRRNILGVLARLHARFYDAMENAKTRRLRHLWGKTTIVCKQGRRSKWVNVSTMLTSMIARPGMRNYFAFIHRTKKQDPLSSSSVKDWLHVFSVTEINFSENFDCFCICLSQLKFEFRVEIFDFWNFKMDRFLNFAFCTLESCI